MLQNSTFLKQPVCFTENSELKKNKNVFKYSLDLILQETVNSVVLTDSDQRILWVNKAFSKITEFSFDEAIGKRPGELLQGKATSAKAKTYLRDKIEAGVPFQCDILNYSKSGREYWIDIKGQPIFDENGKLIQFFSIQTDITERIEWQQKLQDMNNIKDKVISVMSHDVKAPIASLQSVLALMGEDLITLDILPSIFEQLSKSVSSLSLLVENILGWVKVQLQNTGTIQMEDVDIAGTTESIISLYQPIAQNKKIMLTTTDISSPVVVHTNAGYVSLIIRNLVNNAIKFSKEGQNVELSIEDKENCIVYTVKDNGVGMTEEDIKKLSSFETAFTRLGTNNETGSGLGLMFVKESIEKCGGKLIIRSKPGEGSSFCFTLPKKDTYDQPQ